jgi:hypothetical protein
MKIITAVVNNVDFIEIQYHTLKKYFKGEYEFIVFNDAKKFVDYTNDGDLTIQKKICDLCTSLHIQCIDIPNQHHIHNTSAARRCSDSMNFILKYQLKHPDKYLLLDSDMFLIDFFDIEKYANYDCAIVLQSRNSIHYFWNGIYYFDMNKIKNKHMLNWNPCLHCDVGGMMQNWLSQQVQSIPNVDELRWTNKTFHTENTYFIKHLWSCTWNNNELPNNLKQNHELITFLANDPRNINNYFCEIYDNVFLHYRAGGNWNKEGMSFHKQLTQKLKNIILQ